MAYYDALVAKWATLPQTQTAAQINANLATIAALTVTGTIVPVPVSMIVDYMREQGTWYIIKASSNPAALAAVDYNSDLRNPTIDFTLASAQAMLAALVSAGLVTAAQSSAILAMAATSLPWWQSPVAIGGAALTSAPNVHDLVSAGIITQSLAQSLGIF